MLLPSERTGHSRFAIPIQVNEDSICNIKHHLPLDPVTVIVSAIYDDLLQNLDSSSYFNDRAILAPTSEIVNQVNDYMCLLLLGDSVDYLSYDSVYKSSQNNDGFKDLHTTKFLNTINTSGMPVHKLTFKVGMPIMLLRNIDQASGSCNGT
ncbi:uncharacterized protein LOC114712427 [Neltuma alba]|uniref:uncharacterized protein LOC114712427 n=1 Tax=Neltuma alba TaxID=207710 RepID=UPI0010A31062|nr:uncharacterized protein LOC114712427 [Prosopis alba]